MTSVGLENGKVRSGARLLLDAKGFHLAVLELDGGIVEYRLWRNASGLASEGRLGIAIAFLAQCGWDRFNDEWTWTVMRSFFLVISLFFVYLRFTEVQHESVLAFPLIGIQLETHRGLIIFNQSVLTTGVFRQFLPIAAVSDIIINEGLCGWNVRRYLAVLSAGESRLQVVFQTLDPPFSILKEVYHGLRETLFDEWDENDELEDDHPVDENRGKASGI